MAAATALVAAALLGALAFARSRATAVTLGREAVAVEGAGLGGVADPIEVPYGEIDLVVRRDGAGDKRTDGGSFDLVRSGASDVRLSHLRDPETVERILAGRVPDPTAHFERDAAGSDPRTLTSRSAVWHRWPRDEPLPRGPVVDAEAVPDVVPAGSAQSERRTVEDSDEIHGATVRAEELARGDFDGFDPDVDGAGTESSGGEYASHFNGGGSGGI